MKTTSWKEQLELACKYVGDPIESLVVTLGTPYYCEQGNLNYLEQEGILENFVEEVTWSRKDGGYNLWTIPFFAWSARYTYSNAQFYVGPGYFSYVKIVPRNPCAEYVEYPKHFHKEPEGE